MKIDSSSAKDAETTGVMAAEKAVEHTPFVYDFDEDGTGFVFDAERNPIALVLEDKAYGTLLAAAPDLLRELQYILPLVEWAAGSLDPIFWAKAKRSLKNIRAAIAKANRGADELKDRAQSAAPPIEPTP